MKSNKFAFLKMPLRWVRKLYDWTVSWSRTRQAPYALFGIAFAESSFFPIPPDVLLIPMVVADRKRWWRNALICTAGSVLGAFFGYFIGWAFYETAGKFIVEAYHLERFMGVVEQKYVENAFLAIFTAAFTPIPYKVITLAAGLFEIPLMTLFVASVLGRGGRFFLVAATLRIFGERIEKTIEKYFDVFSIAFVVLLVGGFVVIKYFAK